MKTSVRSNGVRSQHDVAGTDLVREIAAGIWLMNAANSGVATTITIQTCVIRTPRAATGSELPAPRPCVSYPHRAHVLCFGGESAAA